MNRTIRWGILGPGKIARKFAAGLKDAEGAKLVAVGSRSRDRAEAFGEEFGVPRRHEGYESLAADENVDVIYVATPHPMHRDNTILCLEAGKAVLCEKPFTMNAVEAEAVIRVARLRKLFCMEAMWTRFLPSIVKLRDLIAAGAIGQVRMVCADFGFRTGFDPQGRLLNPHLGGGGLLDVGVYPLSLAQMILGAPTRIASLAEIGATGVDEQCAAVLGYADGQLAVIRAAVRTAMGQEAEILGTEGRIRLHAGWWRGSRLTLTPAGGEPRDIDVPARGNGYNYQAEEVMRCLREGKTESETMPLDETLTIMRTMDAIRAQWGLKYPME